MGIPAEWGDWIYRALTFLVISCPCALVISIPLSFFGGIGGASARGILIKGSSYLEMLAKTDRVVFDKTGTLTRGTFAVTAVHPAQPELSSRRCCSLRRRRSSFPITRSARACAARPSFRPTLSRRTPKSSPVTVLPRRSAAGLLPPATRS